MNNKGFAISGIIYSILILFLLLIFSIISIMGARKMILDKLKNDVMSELNNNDIKCADKSSLICKLYSQYNEYNETGLLRDKNDTNIYYFKGSNEQVSNNFLWYGGHLWRVVEFDMNEKTLTLITQQPLTIIVPSHPIWTDEKTYESSYINTWLNEYFWNSLDSSIQAKILDNTFNIGTQNDVDDLTTTKKIGLLDINQYERSNDEYSFLIIGTNWSLGNHTSTSIIEVDENGYYVSGAGDDTGKSIRVAIKISDLTITEGEGTLVDSYRTADKATNTNDVQVGEYINVPYSGNDNACGMDNLCTFRVVSKDNDSIKVVLNGLLPNTSSYGSSTTITTNHTVYTVLNTFANGISNTYRYTGNKNFYIGDYQFNMNYKDIQDETLSASVGLATVGEMFSGNDIDLSVSSTKTFVDVNTIENPTASSTYWTMNRYNSSSINYVDYRGILYTNATVTSTLGVRPTMFLKSGLNFTGGEGTAQSPYILK